MSRAIGVENIRDGESRSDQTELNGIIRLEHSGVKESGEKRGRLEQSENTMEREKSLSKREKKSVVRRSERRVRTLVWSRAQQEVYYRTR